jgi:hypothetical protein
MGKDLEETIALDSIERASFKNSIAGRSPYLSS